jgi:hypothetical protein
MNNFLPPQEGATRPIASQRDCYKEATAKAEKISLWLDQSC